MAERAWSHAMEKRQLPDGPNSRQRIYLLGKLRKAVKRASLFTQLCAAKGDSRTSLEAEAYAAYMKGTLLFEQEKNWKAALMNFRKARDVYDELGKCGSIENQVICRSRVEELEPSVRYCLHKVGESSLQTSELLDMGEMDGPGLDLFKAKLEVLLQDLSLLSDNCRSNSCMEHAAGIMEEEKIPEDLSKGVSTTSLTGRQKKEEKFLQDMLEVYESAVGDPSSKGVPRIERFPPPFQAVPCNPIVLDIAYNTIEFPSLENRVKKDKKGISAGYGDECCGFAICYGQKLLEKFSLTDVFHLHNMCFSSL